MHTMNETVTSVLKANSDGLETGIKGVETKTSLDELITGRLTLMDYENVTVSSVQHVNESHCESWQDAQHAIFQLANLCMLLSFLTPYNFRYHSFFLRIMLNLCYLMTLIWSSTFVCMLDVLVWNCAFLFLNSTHLIYIGCKIAPVRFSKALGEIYSHSFKPLKVTRKQFKDIADIGSMQLLGKGALYAKQDHTRTGQTLSILLKGRLKVAYDEIFLHSVEANQFIDSPEYDSYNDTLPDANFKVNISATEDCLIFSWSQERLRKHLSRDRAFEHIFDQLVGKDISQKLYEIQERLMATSNLMENMNHRRSSMVNLRTSIVSSSTNNLTKLNCLQGCMYDQPSNLSSNGTYETSV